MTTETRGWMTDKQRQPDGTLHVWPAGDTLTHDIGAGHCPCGPWYDDATPSAVIVVHHSLDGRERTEPDRVGRDTSDSDTLARLDW